MPDCKIITPVVLIIFNRPEETGKVFNAIRKAQPSQLFVIADGPRSNNKNDEKNCEASRKIIEQVDWCCELIKIYSDINLGCGRSIFRGITKVFRQVDRAIILEDDCLPDQTFFRFCQELLIKYEDNDSIMMISGTNQLGKWKETSQSYHYSLYGSIWGWATWKRAWKYYDFEMKQWGKPETIDQLKKVNNDEVQFQHRQRICQQVYDGRVDTWDYQWTFARLLRNGLSIVPAMNLIENIGFGKNATHTQLVSSFHSGVKTFPVRFPLVSTGEISADRTFDHKCFLIQTGNPDPETILHKSEQLLANNKKIMALLLLEKALDMYPNHLDLIYQKAVTLTKIGQTNSAVASLKSVLDIAPDHKQANLLISKLSH